MHARLTIAEEPVLLEHFASVLVVLTHLGASVCFSSIVGPLEKGIGRTTTGRPESIVHTVTIEIWTLSAAKQVLAIEREPGDQPRAFGYREGKPVIGDVDGA